MGEDGVVNALKDENLSVGDAKAVINTLTELLQEEKKKTLLLEQQVALAQKAAGVSGSAVGAPGAVITTGEAMCFMPVRFEASQLEEFSADNRGNGLRAEEWLRRFELAMKAGRWNDEAALIVIQDRLRGPARSWNSNHGVNATTFDNWKYLFKEAFFSKQSKMALMKQLNSCVQRQYESVDDYARRTEGIALQLELSSGEIKEWILDGLRSEYDYLTHAMRMKQHNDITTLINDIRDSVVFQQQKRRQGQDSGATGSGGRVPRSGGYAGGNSRPWASVKQSGQVSGNNESAYRSGDSGYRQGGSGGRCYNCGESGHIRRDCQQRRSGAMYGAQSNGGGGTNNNNGGNAGGYHGGTAPVRQIIIDDTDTTLKPVTLNGVERNALMDTGASITVMTSGVVREMGVETEPTHLHRVGGIGRGTCVPEGQFNTDLVVDGLTHKDVTVTVVPDDAMLGQDLLVGQNLLNRKEVVTVFHQGHSAMVSAVEHPELVELVQQATPVGRVALRAKENITVPARSVQLVGTQVQGVSEGTIMLEEEEFGAGVLCDLTGGEMLVPVANKGRQQVVIRKGAVVKRGYEVEPEEIFVVKYENTRQAGPEPIAKEKLSVGKGASAVHRLALAALVSNYSDVVATSMSNLGRTSLTAFDIDEMEGSNTIQCKPFRLSQTERKGLRAITDQLLEAGMIEPSTSPYASPVLLVKKKNGDWRMVIDYRRLNAQTKKMNFPLPLIDDLLDTVAGKEWYSSLDLAWAYFQIPMAPGASKKAAFVTPDGHFEPKVMMMGLMNAPAAFQSLMNLVKARSGTEAVCPYLDDLICASDTAEEHLEQLELIFKALREANLTVRLEKCRFLDKEVDFLGFQVSKEGVKPGELKANCVKDFPSPCNVHEVRRFLGLASFFRRFMKNFALVASPISELLKKGVEFKWSERCQEAFKKIKEALTSEPVVIQFRSGYETELHTDASSVGLGAILLQKHEGKWRMVYAISRKLSSAERNYHSTRLEMLALVWGMERLRHYLHGQEFVAVTDCAAVAALKTKAATPQHARWLDKLAEFNFTIRHKPGKDMAYVDALSRAPVEESVEEVEERAADEPLTAMVRVLVTMESEIAMAQAQDEDIRMKMKILKKDVADRTAKENSIVQGFMMEGGVVYKIFEEKRKNKDKEGADGGSGSIGDLDRGRRVTRKLFVVPKAMRKYMVVKYHDFKGHYAPDKVLQSMRKLYWFHGMKVYIRQHDRACVQCMLTKDKTGKKQGLCNAIEPGRRPFQKVFVDHLGPLPKSKGNEHIIALVDGLSKFTLLKAVPDTTTENVIKFLKEIFERYGAVDCMVSDRGTAFTSKLLDKFLQERHVRHILISTQHPQSNGQVERVNKEIARLLRSITTKENGSDWSTKLSEVQRLINTTVSKSTGRTPFEVLHGYVPRYDNDVLYQFMEGKQDVLWKPADEIQAEVRASLREAQKKYVYQYDRKRCPHTIRYSVGDVVVVSRLPQHTGVPTKLQPRYRGPMVITEVLPKDTYRIGHLVGDRSYTVTAHCSQLKLYKLVDMGEEVVECDVPDDLTDREGAVSESVGEGSSQMGARPASQTAGDAVASSSDEFESFDATGDTEAETTIGADDGVASDGDTGNVGETACGGERRYPTRIRRQPKRFDD